MRGALFMTLAMAGFAVEDSLLKTAGQELPTGQILTLFGAGGALIFAVWCRVQGTPILSRTMVRPAILARAGFEMVGRLFYTLAVVLTPLSTTTAILQAAPLVVVGAAALFLGERVGWRRWTAVALGFLGVLLILRPGLDGFSVMSLLAVAGMAGFAGRDLLTRVARGLTNAQFGVLGFGVLVPTGLGLMALMDTPAVWHPIALIWLAGGTLLGVAAYAALTAAMRTGEVSSVTPFRYTRLVFGVALGILLFGEQPDLATLAGSALILGAGLIVVFRSGPRPTARDSG